MLELKLSEIEGLKLGDSDSEIEGLNDGESDSDIEGLRLGLKL